MSQSVRAFDRHQILSLSLVSALSWLSFAALPYEVSVLSDDYHIGTLAAGWMVSAELVAVATIASLFGRSIERFGKRKLVYAGIAVAACSSAVCLFALSFPALILARCLFGAGLGLIAAATNALPAGDPNPERVFGFMMLGLSVLFSVLMFATPAAMAHYGGQGFFGIELLFLLVVGALAPWLPEIAAVPAANGASITTRLPSGAGKGLLSLAIVLLGQGTCWAFAEQAAAKVDLGGSGLAMIFTISALLMLVGAVAATWLGLRAGHRIPLLVGFGLQIAVAICMYCIPSQFAYAAGALALNAAGSFTLPYLQGLLSELDSSGRSAALSGAAINFGAAAGPALSAALAIFSGLAPIGIVTSIILVGGYVLAMSAAGKIHPAHRQPGMTDSPIPIG